MPIPALFSNPDYISLVCKPVFEDYNLSLTGQRFYFIFIHCRKHIGLAYHMLYPMLKWWSDTSDGCLLLAITTRTRIRQQPHTLSWESEYQLRNWNQDSVGQPCDQAGSYCQSYPCSQIIREECFVKKKKGQDIRADTWKKLQFETMRLQEEGDGQRHLITFQYSQNPASLPAVGFWKVPLYLFNAFLLTYSNLN